MIATGGSAAPRRAQKKQRGNLEGSCKPVIESRARGVWKEYLSKEAYIQAEEGQNQPIAKGLITKATQKPRPRSLDLFEPLPSGYASGLRVIFFLPLELEYSVYVYLGVFGEIRVLRLDGENEPNFSQTHDTCI